jgi:hypothetical protein
LKNVELAQDGKDIISKITKKAYKNLACSLKNALRKYNTDNYQHYLNSINNSTNALWKATKNITKQKNKIPPLRNPDNSLAISDLDKANLFTSDLENRFSPNSEDIILNHVNHIESALSNTFPMCLPTKHTSPSEIQYII